MRVDNIVGNGGTLTQSIALPEYTTAGTYTLCIGFVPTGGYPDINLAMTATTGKWYSIGTVTIT
jgi:hypothetical protein